MRNKWYTNKAYVRRNPPVVEKPIEEWSTGLFSLEAIKKDELVAHYLNEVSQDKHFIKHSATSNCYVVGNNVFASSDIAPETELTLCF